MLHLQSINQPHLCEQMLDLMTRDDRESLQIVTSTQRISISRKLLQIFSPLYRDMLRDIPRSDNNPVILIIPDFEAVHVHHLLDLLTSGKIKEENVLCNLHEILNLAKCFKIDLRESDIIVPSEDIREKPVPKIKVKNIQDMIATVPVESLNEEKVMESNEQVLQDRINVLEERERRKWQCTFCLKIIVGGKNTLKHHEENQCRKRPDAYKKCPKCSDPLNGLHGLVIHYVRFHSEGRPLFKCTICDKRLHKQLDLKEHFRTEHYMKTVGKIKSNFNEEPPLFMFESFKPY